MRRSPAASRRRRWRWGSHRCSIGSTVGAVGRRAAADRARRRARRAAAGAGARRADLAARSGCRRRADRAAATRQRGRGHDDPAGRAPARALPVCGRPGDRDRARADRLRRDPGGVPGVGGRACAGAGHAGGDAAGRGRLRAGRRASRGRGRRCADGGCCRTRVDGRPSWSRVVEQYVFPDKSSTAGRRDGAGRPGRAGARAPRRLARAPLRAGAAARRRPDARARRAGRAARTQRRRQVDAAAPRRRADAAHPRDASGPPGASGC